MPSLTAGRGVRAMQLAEGSVQSVDLAFVVNLLSLGEFKCFQDFFHLVERQFEFLDDSCHLLDGIADARGHWRFGSFPHRFRFAFGIRRCFDTAFLSRSGFGRY